MVDGLERREVVILECHAAGDELVDVSLDVARPEPNLRVVSFVRRRTSIHEQRGFITALEKQMVLDRFG